MAGIILKNLTKIYPGGNKAVDDISLEIANGEFVVFVGPSGCGKSTTLRMIAGLEECTSGDIFIGGEHMNGVEPKDRDVALVFQSYALYRHMTVYDNLAFTLRMKKVNKKEIDSRVRQIAEMLEIDHLLSRKPSALSGGESQRVALGRALVRKRKVYLFDEPLSNLDAKLRSSMRAKLIRLHEELGATFVYVTHDQTEAMTMGDRIVVMNKGRIMQCDPPQKIYSHPENMFTAGFIGTPQINFIDGTIPPDDRPVKLAVRPESLLLNCESEDCIYLGSGKVELVELLGANMNVHIDLGKTSVVLITEADPGIARGEVFHVSVRPEDVLVFDSQTGLVMEARSYAAV